MIVELFFAATILDQCKITFIRTLNIFFMHFTNVDSYALSVKRTEGLPFSAYVEFCCQTLEQRSEHESDLLLVALVRLECLIRPIDELLTKKSFSDDHSAPIAMHIKAIRMSLERFWDSLPPSIQQHRKYMTASWKLRTSLTVCQQ